MGFRKPHERTINYGSQLCVRIVRVSPDITDHTMALPESILKLLNADFDGENDRGVYGNMCVLLSLVQVIPKALHQSEIRTVQIG